MILIDGKKAAAELREELKKEVSELKKKIQQSTWINCNFDWRYDPKPNLRS